MHNNERMSVLKNETTHMSDVMTGRGSYILKCGNNCKLPRTVDIIIKGTKFSYDDYDAASF